MKKIVLLTVALSLGAIACKEDKKIDSPAVDMTSESVKIEGYAGATQQSEDTWASAIVLNNGMKWQANKETTDGVMAMLTLLNEANTATTADYKKLGDGLNALKNTVVKECTMKGASHDNLHVWLYPLIKKIELFQKTESMEEGAQLSSNTKIHLEKYFDYFN